jgi:phage terminase small subunit
VTPKQAAFVQEYLIDLNATQAAIRAGYPANSAAEVGYENLRKPRIAEAIAEVQKSRSEELNLTQNDVVRGLYAEAKLTGDGSSHAARVSAWGLLARHMGMLKDRVEHSGSVTLEQLVRGSMGAEKAG